MFKSLIVFSLLVFQPQSISVKVPERFQEVDEYARNIKKSSNFEQTAEKLIAPYDNELDKVRSIFIWITHNVNYDVRKAQSRNGVQKRTKIYANSEEELRQIKIKREKEKANLAFDKGVGVCENYSYLFQFMCEHVGIEADLIGGYGRNDPYFVGQKPNDSNHAWNSVKIDGKWYLLDATWAAGNTDIQKGIYIPQFKEGFFLTPPEVFISTHFPDDKKWQLLKEPINAKAFSKLPMLHPAYASNQYFDHFPKSGLIERKNEITLKIKSTQSTDDLKLLDNRQFTGTKGMKEGDEIIFRIPAKKLRGHELTLAKISGGEAIPIISWKVI